MKFRHLWGFATVIAFLLIAAMKECPNCDGKGGMSLKGELSKRTCLTCEGSGNVPDATYTKALSWFGIAFTGYLQLYIKCSSCGTENPYGKSSRYCRKCGSYLG